MPGLTVIKAGVVFWFVSFMVQDWSPGEQASTSSVIDILMRRRRRQEDYLLTTPLITIIHQEDYGLGIVQQCGQSGSVWAEHGFK